MQWKFHVCLCKTLLKKDGFYIRHHCVRSVRIRGCSGTYFPAFGLNTEIYRDLSKSPYSLRMWENTGQKNSEYGHFLRGAFLETGFPITKGFCYYSPKTILLWHWVWCQKIVQSYYIMCKSFLFLMKDLEGVTGVTSHSSKSIEKNCALFSDWDFFVKRIFKIPPDMKYESIPLKFKW